MSRQIMEQLTTWDTDYLRASRSTGQIVEALITVGRVEGAVIRGAADALVHAGMIYIGPDETVRMLKDLIELASCSDAAISKHVVALDEVSNDNAGAKCDN